VKVGCDCKPKPDPSEVIEDKAFKDLARQLDIKPLDLDTFFNEDRPCFKDLVSPSMSEKDEFDLDSAQNLANILDNHQANLG
jgi:hypothetical protein